MKDELCVAYEEDFPGETVRVVEDKEMYIAYVHEVKSAKSGNQV